MSLLDSDAPSLMQCFAIAADAHQQFHQARIAPAPRSQPEPPDNPLVKRALDQLQDGDLKGCVATMRTLDKAFDPNQPRDPNGKWTHGAANSAGRIAHATAALERALRTLTQLPEDRADELPHHLDHLASTITALERELQALPPDARELAVASRRALASARAHLQRVHDSLERILDYFSRRPRPQGGNGRGGDGLGKAAAPLILAKRVETPMDIDRLEKEADALLRKVAHALDEDLDDDDDDADMTDTWSEHADASANGNNASDDDGDGDDDANGFAGDDDEDDGGIRPVNVRKAERFIQDHRNMAPVPVDEDHPAHPYQTDLQAAGQRPNKHKFESKIDFIRDRDGCSKTEAQQRARAEHPVLYRDYQEHVADETTSQQHTRRAGYGVGKRAATTYETLVSREMAKGCTMEVAQQRIANTYGTARQFPRSFGKSSDPRLLVKRLDARIDELCADNPGVTRTEALRALRKSGEVYL